MSKPVLNVYMASLVAGLKLPSEELIGRLPTQSSKMQRAYLSNVCTAQAAQRQVCSSVIPCCCPALYPDQMDFVTSSRTKHAH